MLIVSEVKIMEKKPITKQKAELLFKVQGSCKPLFLSSESVVHKIDKELKHLVLWLISPVYVDNTCCTRKCTFCKGGVKMGKILHLSGC